MKAKLKLNSEVIANNQFTIASKGYDAFEVDSMLDKIVLDYETIENNEILSKEDYEALNNKINELNKKIIQLQIDLKKEQEKNHTMSESKKGSLDNYELLQRIGKLEKFINERMHISLEEIDSIK